MNLKQADKDATPGHTLECAEAFHGCRACQIEEQEAMTPPRVVHNPSFPCSCVVNVRFSQKLKAFAVSIGYCEQHNACALAKMEGR